MRFWTATILGVAVLAAAPAMAQSQQVNCTPRPAGAEEVTSTAAASDTSSELQPNMIYWLKCDTAAYIDTSNSATCTAASGDFKLPADVLFPFLTTRATRYMCARNVTVDGSCWLWECR